MRVLIADDQRSVGLSLADMVRYCGHEIVAVVGSGLDAINAYSLHHPDLVLMDYRMPKLNGGTACRHILAKDPDARVILISGWSPSDGADASGAISFLSKPVDMARLNAAFEVVAKKLPLSPPAGPEVYYQPDVIDYFQPIVEPLPPVPQDSELTFPAESCQSDASAMPVQCQSGSDLGPRTSDPMPEINYQPQAIDYFPTIAEPLPAAPASESTFPTDAPPSQPDSVDYFPRITEPLPLVPSAVVQEKKSAKPRSNRRRAQRPRVR